MHFRPFWLLWPWPWPNDLHIPTWPVSHGDIQDVRKWTSYVKTFESYRIKSGECVDLITSVYFRSREKDDSHTNRSAVVKNPMLHANHVALSVVGPELWAIEVLHCGNRNVRPYMLLWPDLDPMTFIDINLILMPTNVQKWTSYVKAFESYRLTDKPTDRQVTRGHFRNSRKPRKPHDTRKPHGSICYRTGVLGDRI